MEESAPRARTRDAERTKRALLEAAVAVFGERGYDRATTKEIAQRAGYSHATLFHHFSTKQGLLSALITDAGSPAPSAYPSETTVEAELLSFLLRTVDQMWEKQQLMKLWHSLSALDRHSASSMRYYEQVVDAYTKILSSYRDRGVVRADVDLQHAARTVVGLGTAFGYMEQLVWKQDPSDVKAAVRTAVEIFTRGLLVEAPAGSEGRRGSPRRRRAQANAVGRGGSLMASRAGL